MAAAEIRTAIPAKVLEIMTFCAWCRRGNRLCGKERQQMKLEVSDESGTEGFGMGVTEGCDRAKDFSIKAPRCVHGSSEWSCLLEKA